LPRSRCVHLERGKRVHSYLMPRTAGLNRRCGSAD